MEERKIMEQETTAKTVNFREISSKAERYKIEGHPMSGRDEHEQSMYLLLLFSLPIMLEANFILHLWLGIVPEHTVNFIRLTLTYVLLDAFINPMFTANLASGKLKLYYVPIMINSFSFMFITYFAIRFTLIPESVFLCYLAMNIIGLVIRVIVLNKQVRLSPKVYIKSAIFPSLLVTSLAAILPSLTHLLVHNDILRFLVTSVVSLISTSGVVYFIGITAEERQFANRFIENKISNINHKKMI